jgi:MFS family permease
MWIGQSVSQSGDSIFAVAIFWLVLTSTGSAFYIGLLSAVIYSSQIIFGVFSGVYIDRLNRRTLLVVANVVQATLTGLVSVLYIKNSLGIASLVPIIFFIFGFAVVIKNCVSALVPAIVTSDDLPASNGLFSLTSSLNSSFNYAIGGLILTVLGVTFSVVYDSLTFVFASIATLTVRKEYGIRHRVSLGLRTKAGFREELGEGLRYVRSTKLLLEITLFGVIVNFLGTGAITLLAPYARVWVHGGAETYGLILGGFSIGGIFASLAFGKVDLRNKVGKVLLLGDTIAGVTIALMGIATSTLVAIPLSFVFGFLIVFSNLPIQVLMQASIPNKLYGRVYAAVATTGTIAQPFSALLAGSLATTIPIGELFLVFGLSVAGSALLAYAFLTSLRRANY